ncbi:CDP-glycerol glycerophosphotransferase family protein [Clostridium sp. Ade.TY]|uniref:CDP-glycerol glycerophosphotransferase family protein n=1 Tax=Clostridium sp. Ade.TY TaxID=1391647 RepID=UPI0003F840B6|nr:CDP-glycerol glycerophosphotransferase family protein [Clostridium sp. Ade.TY]
MVRVLSSIESIELNTTNDELYIRGFAFIKGVKIDKNYKIKKSIYIYNENEKFVIPIKNEFRADITYKYMDDYTNYDYSGFEGIIDLSNIAYRKSLDVGVWKFGIYLNTGDKEVKSDLNYTGDINKIKKVVPKEIFIYNKKAIKKQCLKFEEGYLFIDIFYEYINYKAYIKNILTKNPLIYNCKLAVLNKKRKFGNLILKRMYKIFKFKKIIRNRVVFLSDSRTDFSGNFEFIYKELKERGEYDIKSILKPSITARRSLKEMITLVYYIATSKYILLDDYYPQIYKYDIRDEIEVIQLWHATGAFKTFGFSRVGKEGGPKFNSRNHRNYTKVIVSSNNISKYYAEAFGISENKIVSTGVPRTDIFFDENYKKDIMDKLYSKYSMIKNKKVILFAPTFRGNGQSSATYDFRRLNIKKLYDELKDNYILILKFHPFIKNNFKISNEYKDFVLDLSKEREINDLLFITDILITDYSSVCFEYSLLERPMIFFAYDLENYIESRDFYYPYEKFIPGPIARNTDEILDIIIKNNFKMDKLSIFRNKFFDHFDGKSTKRVVDTLLNLDN